MLDAEARHDTACSDALANASPFFTITTGLTLGEWLTVLITGNAVISQQPLYRTANNIDRIRKDAHCIAILTSHHDHTI